MENHDKERKLIVKLSYYESRHSFYNGSRVGFDEYLKILSITTLGIKTLSMMASEVTFGIVGFIAMLNRM